MAFLLLLRSPEQSAFSLAQRSLSLSFNDNTNALAVLAQPTRPDMIGIQDIQKDA